MATGFSEELPLRRRSWREGSSSQNLERMSLLVNVRKEND